MPLAYGMPMMMLRKRLIVRLGAIAALALLSTGSSANDRRDEQDAARRAMLEGQVMPFAMIKRRVDGQMGGATYVGSEFNPSSNR